MFMVKLMNVCEIRKKQVNEVIHYLLSHYKELFNDDEIKNINNISCLVDSVSYNEMERSLSNYVKRTWDHDLNSGEYIVVTWNKNVTPPNRSYITFATIGKPDDIVPFCNSVDGTILDISYDAIIGGCVKDGATLVEDLSHENNFTIYKSKNNVINSYNCSTRLITAKQMIMLEKSNYKSLHNELVLDSSKIYFKEKYKAK